MAKAHKLPSGNYRVNLYVGKENGKRIYKSFTASTPKEAEYMALEYKLYKKELSKTINYTLSYAIDKYIEKKQPILSPSSIATYKKIKRLYFKDILNKKLSDITQEDIQKEINKQTKILSPKTVKCNHGFLSAVFKEYNSSFVLKTTLPRNKKFVPNIPDTEAIKTILITVKNTNIEIPVLLAVWLGLRMSEIRGLKWEHIKGDKIHIKQAIVDADNVATIKGTKSEAGTRTLYIPKYLKEILSKQPKTSEYVVTMKRPTIYDNYIRLLKSAGLPHYRFHDLRHANASIMLALNIPDKYAMERLGHSTNSTLKNIYQHTLNSEKTDINNKVNMYFETLMQHEMQHDN